MNKYKWLSFIIISILLVGRVTIAEEEDDEPVPSSLYGPNDHITILHSNNFNKKIYNQRKVFFVEFFASWCGSCIGYAETYKQLAKQLLKWKHIVEIAAVDCADSQNLQLCREHNVEAFPTLKYFKYMSANANDGIEYRGNAHNLNGVPLDIAGFVYNDWVYQKPVEWPSFQTSDNYVRLEDILPTIPSVTSLLAVIVENNPAKVAWAEMIAFANDRRIHIVQIQHNNPIAQQFGIIGTSESSRLLILKKDQLTPLYISKEHDTWLQMQDKINEYIAQFPVIDASESNKDGVLHEKSDVNVPVTWSQFEVQMMDIITALRHMLLAEIPRKSVIKGENLRALKLWVHAMKKYVPGTIPIRKLLYRLNQWINNISTELTSEQWTHRIKTIQDQLGQPLPSASNYMACRGSKAHFRGFPCGIWTLIHAMSVQAYQIEKDNPNFNANNDLIEPFHQFIWHFFTCSECATHFHEGILKRNMTAVVTPADGVKWLWMTHNIVNKFLARTPSDDPAFPKQQFPPASLCPTCRKQNGEFDEEAVLNFMITYYSNLRIDGLKSMPGYKVSDFENGRLVQTETKHLNPKFQIGAFSVDGAEEADQKNNNHEFDLINSGAYGRRYYDGSPMKRSFSVLWLSIIAVVVLFIYMKYRRNRFKIWKTFCYNDYKL